MKYQVIFSIYLALMLNHVLGTLQLHKDEKENGTTNIHNNVNNRGLNDEYKTTKTTTVSTKPVFKALTTTTLKPSTSDTTTTKASLSSFRISMPFQPPIDMRDNTPLHYNNRFLQIPNGYLSYPRPFPIYQHLHPSRTNLVGYFYDFPVYKKHVPHSYK